MSTHGVGAVDGTDGPGTGERISRPAGGAANRLMTETKSAFKTSELYVFLAVLVGILVSAAAISGGGAHVDIFAADKAWLYVTILTVGYLISRGLAKSGSRDPYWDRPNGSTGAPLTERIKTAAQVLAEGEAPGAGGEAGAGAGDRRPH